MNSDLENVPFLFNFPTYPTDFFHQPPMFHDQCEGINIFKTHSWTLWISKKAENTQSEKITNAVKLKSLLSRLQSIAVAFKSFAVNCSRFAVDLMHFIRK